MHDRVLRVLVGRERVPPDTGTERFDEPAVGRDDERAVVPVGVRPVFAHEAEPLPEMDDATPELAAMREDDVARLRVRNGLARRDVLESNLHLFVEINGARALHVRPAWHDREGRSSGPSRSPARRSTKPVSAGAAPLTEGVSLARPRQSTVGSGSPIS